MKKSTVIIWSALSLAIVITLTFFLPLLASGSESDVVIRIPSGATKENVKDSIAKYLGEDYANRVMRAATLTRTDFEGRHGAYLIPEGTSPAKAAHRLAKGAQHPLRITINGFRSLNTLSERVARRMDFKADDFMKDATSEDLLSDFGLDSRQGLALFIDDSYDVYWSASPEEVIRKIGAYYKKVWNEERVEKAAALGLTPAEVMTICSIVDEETNKTDEKGKVGRLYINRLKIGMPLQADPTVRFALNDFTIKRVKGEHLKVDSPFNTYLHRGLLRLRSVPPAWPQSTLC